MNLLGVNDFPLANTHLEIPIAEQGEDQPARVCRTTTFMKPKDVPMIKAKLIAESEIKDTVRLAKILDLGKKKQCPT